MPLTWAINQRVAPANFRPSLAICAETGQAEVVFVILALLQARNLRCQSVTSSSVSRTEREGFMRTASANPVGDINLARLPSIPDPQSPTPILSFGVTSSLNHCLSLGLLPHLTYCMLLNKQYCFYYF